MARRLPGIRGRMETAAVELFSARGFSDVTAAQIADRAGTTERTFFRHFADKADAVFGDETRLREALAAAVAAATPGTAAWAAAETGFRAVASAISDDPASFRRRTRLVAATPLLRARESARGAEWTDLVTRALAPFEPDPDAAALVAALALAAFRLGVARWARRPAGPESAARLEDDVRSAFDDARRRAQAL